MLCYTKQSARNLYRSIQSVIMYHVFTDWLIWSFCVCTMRVDDTDTATTFQTQESVQPFSTISDDAGPEVSTACCQPLLYHRCLSRASMLLLSLSALYSRAICYPQLQVCRANHGLVLCTVRCQRTLCQPTLLESLLEECLLAVSYRPPTSLLPVGLHRIYGD